MDHLNSIDVDFLGELLNGWQPQAMTWFRKQGWLHDGEGLDSLTLDHFRKIVKRESQIYRAAVVEPQRELERQRAMQVESEKKAASRFPG
jgi:hypothetical protein